MRRQSGRLPNAASARRIAPRSASACTRRIETRCPGPSPGRHRAPYRSAHPSPGRLGSSRIAGCTSDSSRMARIGRASGKYPHRPRSDAPAPHRTQSAPRSPSGASPPDRATYPRTDDRRSQARTIAGAERRQLIGQSRDQVETLLIDHPRDHADERPAPVLGLGRKTVAFEELPFCCALPPQL